MQVIASASVTSTSKNYHHDIQTGRHVLVGDEPPAHGGQDAGPAPYDYLLAGLGACTAITLRMYAEKKGWTLGTFKVALNLSKDHDDNTLIERTLSADGPLDDEQWARLLQIAEKTPVTKTIRAGAPIKTSRAR